ncbi:GTP cyclohydrolase I FolE [Lentisphaerota bacterium WC36G]|nr:GTP cyclohydrolase I FolE [Lentisphaerae bacterium WC36]
MQDEVRNILVKIGENPDREGLIDTPRRVEKAWEFMTRGYRQNIDDVVNGAFFEAEYDEMVIVKDIEFYSMCEHHLLPFFGRAHVGYIPNGKVFGVSKLARIVDMFARRLQLQERLTKEVATAINDIILPEGVGVVMEAQHMCMVMRGVQKQHSKMVTSAMFGSFRDEPETRAEFLSLIRNSK